MNPHYDRCFSIGNDIVDLRAAEPPLHPRFSLRVFSASERSAIGSCWSTLWLHWAAKEAAYKALKRIYANLVFSPILFEFDQSMAQVRTPHGIVFCRWSLREEYAYVDCATDYRLHDSPRYKSWMQTIGQAEQRGTDLNLKPESESVRRLALHKIAKELAVLERDLEIDQLQEGHLKQSSPMSQQSSIPRLIVRGRPSQHLLSFSHHGRFVACAFWELWRRQGYDCAI